MCAEQQIVERWVEKIAASLRMPTDMIAELDLCSTIERDEWAENRLPPTQRPALRAIRSQLWREFSSEFFVEDFRHRLSDLVTARMHG